jgi:RNA exonuclease 1
MLTLLYLQFQTLYVDILSTNPGLASEHALAQELDVYNRTNKATYRNVRTQTAAGTLAELYPCSFRP